jgi:hypothetical protein
MRQVAGQTASTTTDSSLFRVFATTLVLSSALMFSVEPLIAKILLPIFGGTPMIWNSCVVFFQAALLLGYAYAWGLSRWFSVRQQVLIQMVVLTLPLLVMPPTVPPPWATSKGNPLWAVLVTVAGAVGLPFFALSTSASVLQNWFAIRARNAVRHNPYFLYAASNLGSFIALIAYPVVVEPIMSLREQRRIWALGYLTFLTAALVSSVLVWRRGSARQPNTADESDRHTSVHRRHRLRWVALAAVPSSLMLAVTTYLSTDIAPMPLLWVVPLALYLLTFVVAFSAAGERFRGLSNRALPLVAIPIVLLSATQLSVPLLLLIPGHLGVFLIAALACHCELAASRPTAAHLTEFYFWVAVGGGLGGLFNTLLAPTLFTDVIEYPLGLVLACALRPRPDTSPARYSTVIADRATPVVVAVLAIGLCLLVRYRGGGPISLLLALAGPTVLAFTQSSRYPRRFAASVAAIFLVGWVSLSGRDLYRERTFFGLYHVRTDATGRHRVLLNGTTLHGMQATAASDRTKPLTYYHRAGPFGQAFGSLPYVSDASEVAVVGLGIGSLASYVRPGQHWTFYEIDPADESIARDPNLFTFLGDCGHQCEVVIGDARLALAGARPRQYALIVLDAFSSDAIPIHLLTKEALELYLTRLDHHGVLAWHISNRHLSLGPVLARLARSSGLVVLEQRQAVPPEELKDGVVSSDWVLIARDAADLGLLTRDPRWIVPTVTQDTPLWTDDYSNILSVIKFRRN